MATVDISDQEVINSVLNRVYIYEEAVDFVKTHRNDDWMVQFLVEEPHYKEELERVLNPDLSNVFAPFTTMLAVKAIIGGLSCTRLYDKAPAFYVKISNFYNKL